MKVLLTGCAGFIGRRVTEILLEKGITVIGMDNMNPYYDRELKKWRLRSLKRHKGFEFHNIDIENRHKLKTVFAANKFKYVINLAARAGVRYSLQNPYVYFTTNAEGTLNLLEQMREFGVKKMVLASTSSLYAGKKVPYREDMNTEMPISPYAASKKAAEALLYTYHHLYGIAGVILRYFTVYGPAGRPDMSYFRFIKLIDEGKEIEVFGDGKQRRDFTYVDDIALGTIAAMETKGLDYEIINLGDSRPVELIYVIRLIENLLNKKAKIKFKPFHKADMFETFADIGKAKELLGWQPAVKIEDGIERTVKWYLENRNWVKNISLKEGDENNK
jgi:UDP-glucuronate 4-epimerase